MNINSHEIASILYEKYHEYFIYTSATIWYEFGTHTWNCEYGQINANLKRKIEDLVCVPKVSSKLSSVMNNSYFRDRVIESCKHMFYSNKQFDTNTNLIGFNNGVYDMSTGVFRNGKPEDYVSLSTGYDFTTFGNTENDTFICNFLEQLFPDAMMRQYMLGAFDMNCKNHIILVGSGSNGKSTLVNLFRSAIGQQYWKKFRVFSENETDLAKNIMCHKVPPNYRIIMCCTTLPKWTDVVDVKVVKFDSYFTYLPNDRENHHLLNSHLIDEIDKYKGSFMRLILGCTAPTNPIPAYF